MAIFPLEQLRDFLVSGKVALGQKLLPPDTEADAVLSALQVGIEAKHMAAGSVGAGALTSVRLLSFSGVDGSGVSPVLGCTLAGALKDDRVAGVLNSSTFADARALFETSITTAAEIQQKSLTDLSANVYIILLIASV